MGTLERRLFFALFALPLVVSACAARAPLIVERSATRPKEAVVPEARGAEDARAAETAPEAPPVEVAPVRSPIAIGKGTRVLIFGDSMVTSGLGVYLEERVVAQGGKFFHVSKPSSTTLSWKEGHALQDLVRRTRPDVVIVALASNELFVPNPRARRGDVRAIVQRIGARPCVWIGPAPWLPEKGIIGVVRESAAPCRFFDSSGLTLERGPDHIHPTLPGGRTWGKAVWDEVFAE